MSPGLMRGDTGGLANEFYLLKPIVSSKRQLSGLKNANCIVQPLFFPYKNFECQITADVCKFKRSVQGNITFIFDVFSENVIDLSECGYFFG